MSRRSLALFVVAFAGCASVPDYDALLDQTMKSSFRDQGIAKLDRLQQDESNAACSKALGKPLPDDVARRIEAAARASVKPPSDGRYIGDWREGEKLAQNGRGMTWTDASASPAGNGGSCYNCHQLGANEISYGTIGPSLLHYGRNRGVADLDAPTAKPIIDYTWTKLWNAKSFNACSGMPRFGAHGLLDETQLKHLMALLLDPQSPVNR
jgi:L-cysteine S-thiosulfotransferase